MKKVICILAFVILALPVCACAVQEVFLPNSRYAVDVPDWMDYNDPVDGVAGVDAYLSEDLEMYYISYPKEQAAERGMKGTARETVRSLRASGVDAEVRKIQGIEMICYRTADEESGVPCIGYVFEDGDWMIEIDFLYTAQEAADTVKEIMETIREAGT